MSKNQSRTSRLRPQTREEALLELKRVLLAERATRLRQAALQMTALGLPGKESGDNGGD